MSLLAATAELDAIARLAAAILDAPSATVSIVGEQVTRIGGSGVSWPSTSEEALLRAPLDSPIAVLDLESAEGGDQMIAEGKRGACLVPLRDQGALLGVLAIYTHAPVALEHAARRRVLDLAQIATQLLVARRQAAQSVAADRAARLAAAFGELVRDSDGRTNFRVALDALNVAQAMHWEIRSGTLVQVGMWEASGRFAMTSREITSTAPILMRTLLRGDVIAAADAYADARTAELAPYLDAVQLSSLLIAPIRHRGDVTSAIVFPNVDPRRWTLDELRFGESLASWLGAIASPGDRAIGVAERRVLTFVEHAPEQIILTDDHGRITYANETAIRTAGSNLLGRSVAELNPAGLKDLTGYERMRTTGRDEETEQPYVQQVDMPNGRSIPLELVTKVYTLDSAPFVGIVGRNISAATKRLDATMATATNGIAHVTLDGQFLRFNDNFCRIVGRPATELRINVRSFDTAPPPERRGLDFAIAMGLSNTLSLAEVRGQLATTKRPFELEYELTRPDGTKSFVGLTIALVADAADRGSYFIVVAREITMIRRADVAMHQLVEAMTSTGDELFARTCAYLATTLDARCVLIGKIHDASVVPIAAYLNGAPFDAPTYPLVGTPCETVRKTDACYFPERLQQLFPEDHMLVDIGVNAYLGRALRDRQGTAIGIIAILGERAFDPNLRGEGMLRMCAARIESELEHTATVESLETRELLLREMTENAQETFWISEWPSRKLIYVSSGFEALTGRTVASAYANEEAWRGNLHPDDRDRIHRLMSDVVNVPLDCPSRVLRVDGRVTWIQIRATVVRDREGRPYRIAGSFEDITQTRATQEALVERERQLAEALASSEREVDALQTRLGEHDELHGMVGSSPLVRSVYRRLRQAAQSDVTVLIAGESGTGKELAASALHALSARRDKPFVAINCAAIPEPLLESELFGHAKGAFTGATRDKVGLMQAAEGGTLFLDEIGDMSPVLQVKLLRALQERQIRRVGDEKAIAIDVRLVSASHRVLKQLVANGRMREDFYYRIKVFEIEMPALRERREDIPTLANHFATELGRAAGKARLTISADASRALLAHRWPGNVRELRNAIEHALVTVSTNTIQLADLPIEMRDIKPMAQAPNEPTARQQTVANAAATPAALREQIEEALVRSGGNRAEAARALGIGRVTLWKRMRRLGMITDDTEQAD